MIINPYSFASGSALDPDAQAFITAASITNPTQQSAINQLVLDLKADGLWTKMKALYPFVGGTASAHKFNLKDPRDLDAAFRLVFSGGWTHSSTGALPNGTNGYADTKILGGTNVSQGNLGVGAYSRSETTSTGGIIGTGSRLHIYPRYTDNNTYYRLLGVADYSSNLGTSRGFFHGYNNSNASNNSTAWFNGTKKGTFTGTLSIETTNIYLSGANPSAGAFDNHQLAFAFVSQALNDTEAANFYTAVQTFQTTLGRSIGTQTVSDTDAQAFVTNAGIVDQVEANAVNNLVIGLKADGLWTKMKAVYPFVGGTSTTNKFNLKNPLDTDAAFRLVFNGGWTFSSTGATPNGTNGYADTKLSPNTVMNFNSQHYCIYKTSVQNATVCEFGVIVSSPTNFNGINCFLRDGYGSINDGLSVQFASTTTAGAYILNRNNTNDKKLFRNGSLFDTKTAVGSNNTLTNVFLGARNDNGAISWYANTQTRFFSIGDGLTDTDATNFYNRVQTFNTALNRNV